MAYLSKYPQQAGLVWLFSMLIRLFGVGGEAFMTLHIFLAVCVPLIVLSGYWLTDAIFEDKEVDVYFLILGMGCIALCAYVNFVYSDIPGILLALLSLNSIVRYGKERKILWGIIGCLLFLFGIVIRKHNMILVVAVTGIWLLYAVIQKSKRHALEAICGSLIVFVGSHFVIQCLGSIYELSFENAEPSIAWVAMGMQRSAYGAGWYNGFVDGVYTDKAGDAALIVQESIRQIIK